MIIANLFFRVGKVIVIFFFAVTWYHDDGILRDNFKYTLSASRDKRTLEIKDCNVSDAGMYKCVAESSKGSTSSHFTLDVTSRRRPLSSVATFQSIEQKMLSKYERKSKSPDVVGPLRVELRLNGIVYLECSVNDPNEVYKVVWRKDNSYIG